MKLTVSNIDWDYSGKEEGKECPFPSQIVIDSNDPDITSETISYLLEDINGEAENLAEYLTEYYECCVCGFTTDVEGDEND